MIRLCSINDKKRHIGILYSTTFKPMYGIESLEFLAPTKELVYGHKYKKMSEEWYIDGYRVLLSERWEYIEPWLKTLLNSLDMTLLCYCSSGKFCHRQLLYKMLLKHRPDLEMELY